MGKPSAGAGQARSRSAEINAAIACSAYRVGSSLGRGHAILQAVGAMGQSGAILALAGAFEWRTAGPGVVTLSAWATPASTGQRTLGLDLVLPVGRTVGGVRLAFEKRTLSTAIPRMIEGDTFDDIGERDSISISLGLTASGDWVGSD
jgi:hypothetical protein